MGTHPIKNRLYQDGMYSYSNWLSLVLGYVMAFTIAGVASAQCCLDTRAHLSDYVHKAWNEQGQSTIRTVTQTQDNHLWLGTQDGIIHYNGLSFEHLHSNRDFRGDEQINVLLETKSGMILAGTTRGLFAGQNGIFSRYTDVVGRVSAILEEQDDLFWFSTTTSGIYRCESNQCVNQLENVLTEEEITVHALYFMNNTLFAGTSNGLYRYEQDTGQTTQFLPGTVVRTLEHQRSNAFFLGTNKGLYTYSNGQVHEAFPELTETKSDVWAVYQKKASVFVGTQTEGLFRIVDGDIERFPQEHVLSTAKIYDIFEDREGTIWIGTEGSGLHQIRTGPFKAYYTGDKNSVLGLYSDDQNLYIGTEGQGMIMVGEQNAVRYDTSNGLSGNVVTSFAGSSQSRLWIGTLDGGLSILTQGKVRSYSGNSALGTDGVYSLYEDSKGAIWIGTDQGVFVYRNGRIEAHPGKPAKNITAFTEGKDGTWVGTYDQGLYMYKSGAFTEVLSATEVKADIVLSLYEAANGALWIGTYEHGLLRYDAGSLTTFGTEDGLPSNTAFQIIEDSRQDLWIGSNQGIYRLQLDQVERYEAGLLNAIPSNIYNEASGIINPEVNGGFQPAGTFFNNQVFFPTINGVLYFDPNEIRDESYSVHVEVLDILVDGVPYTGDKIEIPAHTERIVIKYNPVTFTGNGKILIRHSISQSLSPKWVKPTLDREVVLSKPEGTSYVELQAANLQGGWGETTRLTIETIAPFYKTFGFWLAISLGVMLTGTLIAVVRYRAIQVRQETLEQVVHERTSELKNAKNRIEKQAVALQQSLTEKEMLLKEIHHRVRNNLQVISGLLYLQSNRIEDEEILNLFKQSEARIEAIAVVHEKLYASGNVEKIKMDEYLSDLTQLIATGYQADERNIRLTMDCEDIVAKSDFATSIGLILNELVSNVFKHAFDASIGQTHSLHVSFKKQDNHYSLQVRDNGKGMKKREDYENNCSLGIKIIQAFCDKLNATFAFESQEGTISTVIIPIEVLIE